MSPKRPRKLAGDAKPAPRAAPKPARSAEPAPQPPRAPAGTSAAVKISASVGIVAATVLAVLLNILVARHYKRWDWTRGGLYTLSDSTVSTLRSLEEPVQIYVLLSVSDPLTLSVRHLLEAYRSETTRLEVTYADPDRHPAEFLAIQQRFGIVPGKTDDGRIVTDAAIVVVRGDRPYFITSRDLVEVEDEEDLRARPRVEQALTMGIRNVLGGDRPKACVTTGHGEKSTEVGGDAGFAPLRERLTKNNYEVVDLPAARALGAEKDPLPGCRFLILAAPTEALPHADVARYRAYLEGGGSALLVVGPVPDADDKGYVDLGYGDLLAVAGVKQSDDFVFELEPKQRSTQGFGETFMPIPKPHPVTEGLMKQSERGLSVVMTVASSLVPTGAGVAAPAPILSTSDKAFGMVDFFAWAEHPSAPVAGPADHKGPLTVAYATELPKRAGSTDPYGTRIVVVSSSSVIVGANWQSEELRGTALFIESAISWVAARPVIVDIPNKPSAIAGLHIDEQSMASIFRYVVIFIPLASLLLGVAVYLRRRGTERRGDGTSEQTS